jgi:hypothetical protein
MMTKRTDEEKLRASLVEALEGWWDNGAQATEVHMPYVGDETFIQMANAALAVFVAIADVQESAVRDGYFKEVDV